MYTNTLICDVLCLLGLDFIFLQRQHKLYLIFCVSNLVKSGHLLQPSVNVKKSSVSASGGVGFAVLTQWPGALPLDLAGGSASRPTL